MERCHPNLMTLITPQLSFSWTSRNKIQGGSEETISRFYFILQYRSNFIFFCIKTHSPYKLQSSFHLSSCSFHYCFFSSDSIVGFSITVFRDALKNIKRIVWFFHFLYDILKYLSYFHGNVDSIQYAHLVPISSNNFYTKLFVLGD